MEQQGDDTLLKSFIELGEHCPKFLRPHLDQVIELMLKVMGTAGVEDAWKQLALEMVVTVAENGGWERGMEEEGRDGGGREGGGREGGRREGQGREGGGRGKRLREEEGREGQGRTEISKIGKEERGRERTMLDSTRKGTHRRIGRNDS